MPSVPARTMPQTTACSKIADGRWRMDMINRAWASLEKRLEKRGHLYHGGELRKTLKSNGGGSHMVFKGHVC